MAAGESVPGGTMTPATEFTYDGEADAVYIGLATGFAGRRVTRLSPDGDVVVEMVGDTVVGIEILGVASHPIFGALIPKAHGLTLTRIESGY